jgi:non-specific serine/threonine protein kinase/serine/threonine-protein kinase
MTPELWAQVKAAFDEVRDLPPDERSSRLAEMLARDAGLHRHVVTLLEADRASSGFLEHSPFTAIGRAIERRAAPPPRIGAYRIVREIGRGGMGVVLLGARDDDAYQKDVAIKVMRAGGDHGLLRRFTDERRILAQLTHPNIAVLLDGGTTERGEPFLVMEYIDGKPIDTHCNAAGLSIHDRLRLFLLVCAAVQHAHQRLVVHRDIKPANILVTGEGVPKLLDFGIAKLLAHEEGPGATVTVAQLLTPEYAIPEQIRGEAITVATDVYALGVVLYHLLTGTRPYAPTTDRPHELARAICEDDPARPSSRKSMAGDLDTIVLKALQKNPERRYSSVEAFAADITRYLEGRPVLAHADSIAYRASKFVRRHRSGVIAAAALAIAVIGGAAATFWQWRTALANQAIAERRFNDVRSLARSVVFEIDDAVADLPGATKARALIVQKGLEYLDAAGKEAAGDRDLQLEVAAAYARISEIQDNVGTANLGDEKAGMASAEKALAMRRSVLLANPDHVPSMRAYASSLRQLALLKSATPAALDLYAELIELREKLAAITSEPQDLYNLAATHHSRGQELGGVDRLDEALREYDRALAGYEARLTREPDHQPTLRSVSLLKKNAGAVYHLQGRFDLALASFQRALEIDEAQLAREPDSVQAKLNKTFALGSVGGALAASGRTSEALTYHRRALAIREELSALDPANVTARAALLRAYHSLGQLQVRDDPAGALATLQRALRVLESATVRTRELDRAAARIHGGIGDAYVAVAKAGSGGRLRAERYRQAIASYERSRTAFEAVRATGALTGPDAAVFTSVMKAIAELRGSERWP